MPVCVFEEERDEPVWKVIRRHQGQQAPCSGTVWLCQIGPQGHPGCPNPIQCSKGRLMGHQENPLITTGSRGWTSGAGTPGMVELQMAENELKAGNWITGVRGPNKQRENAETVLFLQLEIATSERSDHPKVGQRLM